MAFFFVGYIAVGLLSAADWNPTVFIKFGTNDPKTIVYAESQFDEVVYSPGLGHDGHFFFMQAMDPLYLSPEDHAAFLDRPTYRAQRMLYPALAGLGGTLPPMAVAWTLLAINLIAVGVGTWLTALLAQKIGLSPAFGLAFLINPGVFVPSVIDTAEVLAMVFLVASMLFVLDSRWRESSAFLTFAVLSRETMLVAVLGLMVYLAATQRRIPKALFAPILAAGLWWGYVRIRIGYLAGEVQDTRAFGRPFEGFLGAFKQWVESSDLLDDMLIGILLVLATSFFLYLAIRRRSVLAAMVAGNAVIAVFMVEEVWLHYFDSTRALTPVVTFFFLLAASTASGGDSKQALPSMSLSA
ncbi:MAG TPA: DUF2079 domain-containing protein [Acidimicrobiia bacterium]